MCDVRNVPYFVSETSSSTGIDDVQLQDALDNTFQSFVYGLREDIFMMAQRGKLDHEFVRLEDGTSSLNSIKADFFQHLIDICRITNQIDLNCD